MADRNTFWTIEELAEESESSVRTIRYYISEGLLPKPQGRGRATIYTAEHLQRLHLIHGLVAQRVPLSEIRDRITALSPGDLEDLLENTQKRQQNESQARTSSPKEYLSALLSRAREERKPPQNEQLLVMEPQTYFYESAQEEPTKYGVLWTRYELAPGVELHVSRPAEKKECELVRILLETVSKEGRRR